MRRAARLAVALCAPQRLSPQLSLRRLAHAADPYGARAPLPGVAHCVAVASGKGGVGKSTTAVNLAVAARALGLRVALLDADVYGPSLPLLMGLPSGVPPRLDAAKRMLPPTAHGVPVMSMGLLLKEGSAAAWRGPMVMGALEKLIRGTAWPELDLLLIDMPPGTGDAHISVSQKLPLSGAVVVSTPQEVALVDARRGVDLYRQVGVTILGMIENMAWYDDAAGGRVPLFGAGGVARAARDAGVELLAEVPLLMGIRAGADAGTPAALRAGSPEAAPYERAARRLAEKLRLLPEAAQQGVPEPR